MNGQRVRKLVVGGSDNYYVNGADGKTETIMLDPTGYNYLSNIFGNDLVGQIRITGNVLTERNYFLKDHLGSIRMTLDSSGSVIGYDDYYPFGSIMSGRSMVSGSGNKYKFTGKERDTNRL